MIFIKAAISRDRLLLLIRFFYFDDDETKRECKDDKFGHIHKISAMFNHLCKELYGLELKATSDEELRSFTNIVDSDSTCRAEIYGIKYWTLAKAENHYCYNFIPFLGKKRQCHCLKFWISSCYKTCQAFSRVLP